MAARAPGLATLAALAALVVAGAVAASPTVPVWPPGFTIAFNETTHTTGAHSTTGVYYYDAANNRSRMDRANGYHDRYCGSVKDQDNLPCQARRWRDRRRRCCSRG